ncbi:MAG: RagB/SusD family nutrient uptake outer membrane protein [Bacteroidales bacterium]|nr:RagB/SusD family nutrient uptake outer membrane protein [Bacteroidales bacterium]
MKKYKINWIWIIVLALFSGSCEDYLDRSPDDGLSEDDVYKDYNSLLGFMDRIFLNDNILIFTHNINSYSNIYTTVGNLSDEYAAVRNDNPSNFVNAGNWLENAGTRFEIGCKSDGANFKSAISRAYTGLRIVNRVIDGADKVQSITEDQKKKLLGQAHFLRAYFYFELIKRYGGMPVFDQLWGASDNFDFARNTYQGSNTWMQTDLDKAIEYLPPSWPPEEHGRPDKVSAMALKAMTQLYAASPLMQNDLTTIENNGYGKELAAEAARSAQQAIDAIESHQYYRLMNHDEYRSIQLMPNTNQFAQPEYLWFLRWHPANWSAFVRAQWLTQPYDDKTGAEGTPYNAPTQNMVDLFERKGTDGKYYPITDSRSGYGAVMSTDPYTDRDPRLANNILVPGEQWGQDMQGVPYYVTTYSGGYSEYFITTNQFTNASQQTGYMCKKFIWPEASTPLFGATGFDKYRLVSVYIRVSQVYLDMAEASYEATGSEDAVVSGCTMSARAALNKIRVRAGIGELPGGVDFREAYRRERAVELMFEGHRWYDIRRWMIAEDLFKADYPIMGVKATPLNHTYTDAQLRNANACKYKLTDFSYEYVPVTTAVRTFNKRNYWYPLPMDEVAALDNLQQNPYWN